MATTINPSTIDRINDRIKSLGYTPVDHIILPGEVIEYYDEEEDRRYEETENDTLVIRIKEDFNWSSDYDVFVEAENFLINETKSAMMLDIVKFRKH